MEFFEGRFKWRNKTFHELHPMDQMFFLHYPVSLAELKDPTRKKILETFLRVNTTGKPQKPAHIEKVKKALLEEK